MMAKNARGDHKSKAKDNPSKTTRRNVAAMKEVMRQHKAETDRASRDDQHRPGRN